MNDDWMEREHGTTSERIRPHSARRGPATKSDIRRATVRQAPLRASSGRIRQMPGGRMSEQNEPEGRLRRRSEIDGSVRCSSVCC